VVLVPSLSGATARNITRYRLPVWIVVVSEDKKVCQDLVFSYGIYPVHEPDPPQAWNEFAHQWLSSHTIEGDFVVLATGPSPRNPEANNRIELIEIRRP
jgi:pyruvate kinase